MNVDEEVITSSRTKSWLFLVISVAFCAIAAFAEDSANHPPHWRTLVFIFFGLCAAVFAALLVRPQRLTLDAEGFTVGGGLVPPSKERKIPWRDVERFVVCRLSRGGDMIGIVFTPGAKEHSRLSEFNRRTFGVDGSLPRLWPDQAAAMVEELNAYRAKALGARDDSNSLSWKGPGPAIRPRRGRQGRGRASHKPP